MQGDGGIMCAANGSDLARFWALDPEVTYLNHGSFGACPRAVLEAQRALRDRMEAQPIDFLHREYETRLDAARAGLATFLGANPEDLAFVPNATAGVNTILRSLPFAPGDELVVTDHEYNACRNALDATAGRTGASVVVATVPFPSSGPEQAAEAVLSRLGPRTRLLLVDHVTSPTAMILPIETILREAVARGIEVLIDGAHAPGMLPLDIGRLERLGAAFYTGNCHKWLCAPKGAGFLWVRRDRQGEVQPLAVSHGKSMPRSDRSRFQLESYWTGTADPTAYLCVPEAIAHVGGLVPGGWPEVQRRNRALALEGRAILCDALDVEPGCPEAMIGSMATITLPDAEFDALPPPLLLDPLQERLRFEHGIEVPILHWPATPRRWVRISAQLYNAREQYERLAGALKELLGR
jgi:isopenicillin-N epimerase